MNLFTPDQLAGKMSSVRNVGASVLKPTDSDLPFTTGWGDFLGRYFRRMPPGFTSYYFFEFFEGQVLYRHLTSTPDEQAERFIICDDFEKTRRSILGELFGVQDVRDASMIRIRLPQHPGNVLKKSKIESLSKKYFSIPPKCLAYYPRIVDECKERADKTSQKSKSVKRTKKEKKAPGAQLKKRKPGRPRKSPALPEGTPSILKFFRTLNKKTE